jgi:hypothetical protein
LSVTRGEGYDAVSPVRRTGAGLTSSSRGRPAAPVLGCPERSTCSSSASDGRACGTAAAIKMIRAADIHRERRAAGRRDIGTPLRDNCGRLRARAARPWGEPAVGASGHSAQPSIDRAHANSQAANYAHLCAGCGHLVTPRIVPRGFRGCPETARRPRWVMVSPSTHGSAMPKDRIIEALGEHHLLLPGLVSTALTANDRVK